MMVAGQVGASTPAAGALLRLIDAQLDDQYGPGTVPRPSTASAYRHLARLTKGTNALTGSAKGRRSIADRPKGVYGRLRAARPGEYVILDTQDLDVFAMEPVTCRWVRAQLTVAQDLFTRCITGLRVTPVSTKAVDVAGVLSPAGAARPAPEDCQPEASWPYPGAPQQLLYSEAGRLAGIPVCPPETLVNDHGKAFLSAHVISVCARLGISIQPAQPKKPTDKPRVAYCTSSGRFVRSSRLGWSGVLWPAADLGALGRVGGVGRVVEVLAFVVIPLGADNFGASPGLDRFRVDAVGGGGLGDGEHPGDAQPLAAAA